jgi:hypothetical protein
LHEQLTTGNLDPREYKKALQGQVKDEKPKIESWIIRRKD